MTLQDIERFLKDNAARLRRLGDRSDTSLGFNAFALVSDTYYRENFHSDIIRAILDPHSGHEEGALFLKKFIDFISAEARSAGKSELADTLRKLAVDDSAEVTREEGRVDVKIKAPGWTIIVENKINGAGDMERQIPRYIAKCRAQGENVVAVVYLTARKKGSPSTDGWEPGDLETVRPLLIPVIGFSETRSERNLAEDWIGPCALAARGFHAKAILEQYAELLRHQSGETMNQDEIKSMLFSMAANGIQYSELLRTLQEMPRTLASIVVEEFKSRETVLKGAFLYPPHKETVAVLNPKDIRIPSGGTGCFGIDVHCEDLGYSGISFFNRSEDGAPNSAYVGFLKEFDPGFELGWADRVVLTVDPDWAFGHVDEFLAKIRGLLDHLERNRERLEAICRGEATDADARK